MEPSGYASEPLIDDELLEALSDEQLLELARDSGGTTESSEALDLFVTRHRAFAVNFANTFVREANLAQDFAQEGFLKLYEMLPGYEATGSARGLLAKLIRNACLTHLKREGRSIRLSGTDDGARLPAGLVEGSAAEAHIERKQTAESVRQALEALSPLQREVVRLRYYHSFSYREISEALDITVNHVGVALHSALARLGDELRRAT